MGPAYLYRALIRKRGRKNTFRVPWMPHARFAPLRPLKRIAIHVDPKLKESATVMLSTLDMTWTEFVTCKLEDWCLSQKEYDRKWLYWQERYTRQGRRKDAKE